MDPVTQALFGVNAALLAKDKRTSPKAALILGAASGMAPDLDILIRSSSDPLLAIEYHRLFTHSIFFVPIGAWLVAIIVWWLLRQYTHWMLGSFKRWYAISALAMLTHAPLDMCTSYGTSFLWPLSDARLDWSIVAVIDPLVTLPMMLLLSWGWLKRKRVLYGVSACYVVCYLLIGAYNQYVVENVIESLAHERGHNIEHVLAKPALFVNVLWRTIYEHENRYYVDAVRLRMDGQHRVYPGTFVDTFDKKTDLPHSLFNTQYYRDVERFEHFSQGMIYQVPGRPNLIGDIRYSMIPNQIGPLWGIELNYRQPEWHLSSHVNYVTFHDVTPKMRTIFWRMIMGKSLEIADK